jgi:hypothetical protein
MKRFAVVLLMFLWMEHFQIAVAWGNPSGASEFEVSRSKAQQVLRRESMKKAMVVFLMFLWAGVNPAQPAWADEFKEREAKIAQYKKWLDNLGPEGSKYWVRLDARRRPHRLYLGEGFYRANVQSQERFVDTFSNYLAGHPEKFMLIDLFDDATHEPVGEYGFGGFKLYPKRAVASKK